MRKLVSLFCVVIGLSSSMLHASPIVDQENWPVTSSYGVVGEWPRPGIQHAQTFVAGQTGTLQTLELMGEGRNPFVVEIRGQISGHPDTNVLQKVAMPGFNGFSSATLVPFQISVLSGELLSFVVYQPENNVNLINRLYGSVGPYAGGNLWTSGSPDLGLEGPGTWYPNGNFGSPMSFYFRTIVEVSDSSGIPEPDSIFLFVLVSAIMIVSLRGSGPRNPLMSLNFGN